MISRFFLSLLLLVIPALGIAEELDGKTIVRDAINHWRGVSSYTEMTMVIHRPDWERSMTMSAWTKGAKQTLVRVIEPKRTGVTEH